MFATFMGSIIFIYLALFMVLALGSLVGTLEGAGMLLLLRSLYRPV
jgi:hypothetical protein